MNAQFTRDKEEIQSKYAKKKKELERQLKRIDCHMEYEIGKLKDKLDADIGKRFQYEIREKAGTLDKGHDNWTCGTCGKLLPRDASDPDDLDSDRIFIFEAGRRCGSNDYHCNERKRGTTTCTSCGGN